MTKPKSKPHNGDERTITALEDYRGRIAKLLCKLADEYRDKGDRHGANAISDATTRLLIMSMGLFPNVHVHDIDCEGGYIEDDD